MSILHEIVGTIKADEYGYIYDSDRTLKETILRENTFQNIFKFLKIPSQNYAIRDLREVSKYNDWIKVESNIPNCSSISRMEIKVTERTHSFSVELKIKVWVVFYQDQKLLNNFQTQSHFFTNKFNGKLPGVYGIPP